MDQAKLIFIIIMSIVAGLIVLYFAYLSFVFLLINKKLNIRYDGNPLLRYFTYEDFPDLKAEPFSFKTKTGNKLRGNIYTSSEVVDFNKVIIFFHGIGTGHLAYTKEINRLVKDNKIAVIAYDYHGTGASEGKNIIDLNWALVDADYFLKYLKTEPRFIDSDLILLGHSWGGLVAGNIISLNLDPRIKKTIVLNGLPSVGEMAAQYVKGKVVARIFYHLLSRIKMKQYANKETYKSLKQRRIPALIVHGELDPLVPIKLLDPLFALAKKVDYIEALKYPHHHHFVYLTPTAEEELRKMQTQIKKLKGEELLNYAKTIDYDLIGQQNEQLFETISQFIRRG